MGRQNIYGEFDEAGNLRGLVGPDGAPAKSSGRVISLGGGAYPNIAPDLKQWKAAKLRGAARPPRHMWLTESHGSGEGAGTGGLGLIGASRLGLIDKFADLAGHQKGGFFGDQNVVQGTAGAVTLAQYYGGSGLVPGPWVADAAPSTFGGAFLTAPGGSAGVLSYTDQAPWSKFELNLVAGPGANTAITVQIDGVLVDTINQVAGALTQVTKVYTAPLGIHTIAVGVGANGTGFVHGAVLDDGSGRPVTLRGAWCGGKAQAMANSAAGIMYPAGAATLLQPDLVSYSVVGNDFNAATALETYSAQTEAVVKKLSTSGTSGSMMMCYPTISASVTNGLVDAYARQLRALAEDYGWGFYDARNVFGRSNARAADQGYRFDDNHPNGPGYGAWAAGYFDFLKTAGF